MNHDVNIDANNDTNQQVKITQILNEGELPIMVQCNTGQTEDASGSKKRTADTTEDNEAATTSVNIIESPEKAPKTDLEEGKWNCRYSSCNTADDEFMFKCGKCKEMFHYKCTKLPPIRLLCFSHPTTEATDASIA